MNTASKTLLIRLPLQSQIAGQRIPTQTGQSDRRKNYYPMSVGNVQLQAGKQEVPPSHMLHFFSRIFDQPLSLQNPYDVFILP